MRTTWLGVGLSAMALNPLRTALSTLGVVIGVAALVAVLAIGDGVEQYARDQIERTTDLQAIVISPVTTRLVDHQRVPRDDFPTFGLTEVEQLGALLPTGSLIDLSVRGSALIDGPDGEERAVLVQAGLPALATMTEMALESGRFINETESSNAEPVAILSGPLAEVAGVKVGDTMQATDSCAPRVFQRSSSRRLSSRFPFSYTPVRRKTRPSASESKRTRNQSTFSCRNNLSVNGINMARALPPRE